MKLNELRLLTERFLHEGGASGHLMHLYDNRSLTFGELKDVLSSAADGRLEHVTEKLDGMNLVFTWDGDLKVARNGGEIKSGGMDATALAAKFRGHNSKSVEEAFNLAFKVLRDAMQALPGQARSSVFNGGRTWYSIEVIYAQNPNVINYDKNCIVFHRNPIYSLNERGQIERSDDDSGVGILEQNIDRMQNSLTMRSWQVRGPAMMRLKKLSDGSTLERALSAISAAQSAGRVDDNSTIDDYLHSVIGEEVADLGLSDEVAAAVTARIVGSPGAPGLPQIKKMVPADVYPNIRAFVDREKVLMQHAISPIENAIHVFAIDLLRGLQSVLVDDNDAEVARLRNQVATAVSALENSGQAKAMDTLRAQMNKLGSIENIGAAMEGVVFIYKKTAYKFTGSFAPMNQILGMFKYGRGSSKVEERRELQNVLNDLLMSRHL